MEIRTKQLLLRPYQPEDAQTLYQSISASLPQLRQWMDWAQKDPTPASAQATIRRFQQRAEDKVELALAIFRHDGTLIGSSGWHYKRPEVPSFELGYWKDSRFSRDGYMDEAVIAQTDYLFNTAGANRVMIRCHHLNEKSANVARRTGFQPEGEFRNARRHVDGSLANDLVFAHTPESWQIFRQL